MRIKRGKRKKMPNGVSRGFDTYRNYDWMYQRLVIEKKLKKEVAKECGCDNGTISRWVIRLGVQELILHTNQNKTLIKICKQCRKEFEVAGYDKNQEYCSQKCWGISKRKRIKLVCEYCGEEFEVPPCLKNQKYCSYQCHGISRKGEEISTRSKIMMSESHIKSWQNPIVWERYSKARKRMWRDPKFQKTMAITRALKPNKLEQYFDELTPECVCYVGDFKFPIKTKNGIRFPDFVIEGQDKIIELFGDFYHKGENPEYKIKEYAEVGWECIVFWENEVLNEPERVLDETLGFITQKRFDIKLNSIYN